MKTIYHAVEVRFALDETAPGLFEGYGSVYGVLDTHNTVFMPGVFAASLTEHRAAGTRPMMLWQHSPTREIGEWLEIREDAQGLFVRGRIDLQAPGGAKAHRMLKGAEVRGLSVGFRRRKTSLLADGSTAILAAELIEISPVRRPSNPRAHVTDVRSAAAGQSGLAASFRRCAALIGGK